VQSRKGFLAFVNPSNKLLFYYIVITVFILSFKLFMYNDLVILYNFNIINGIKGISVKMEELCNYLAFFWWICYVVFCICDQSCF